MSRGCEPRTHEPGRHCESVPRPPAADRGRPGRRAGRRCGRGGRAGLAAGVATERTLVRRLKADPADRYAHETFGAQRYDEAFRLELPDGTDIHVEVVEPTRPVPGHPTVVLVHGFCLDMGTFHFQRQMLAARGDYRIVAYDQPGHGLSGRLETGEYDLTVLGRTLRQVIDRTAPDGPLVLVGHSMGGMTIMAFAELFPELFGDRVVGTVLMATSGGLLAETKLVAPALLGRVGGPVMFMVSNATRYGGPVIDKARKSTSNVAWLLTRKYGFGTRKPSPALVSYVETMNSRTSADTVTRYLRTLATHSRFPARGAGRHPGAGRGRRQGHDHSGDPLGGDRPAAAARRVREDPGQRARGDAGARRRGQRRAGAVPRAPDERGGTVSQVVKLPTVEDTQEFGRRLAGLLRAGDLVLLTGPLGAGKTALTQGIGAGLGVLGDVTSPTFVIARVHKPDPARGGRVAMVHADAYRLGAAADPRAEIDDLDLDASVDASVTVVEWGEGLVEQLVDAHLRVRIDRRDDDTRIIELDPVGGDWARRLADL
ncbi:hypothetical protein GCM10027614_58570 [Micromonospora vulcania]